jgi:hypothetical protein
MARASLTWNFVFERQHTASGLDSEALEGVSGGLFGFPFSLVDGREAGTYVSIAAQERIEMCLEESALSQV